MEPSEATPDLETSVPEAEAICVEYPGLVRNVGRALETFGGEAAISGAEGSIKPPFLQLLRKPGGDFCHPVYGSRHPDQGLVLRLSRPKGHMATEDAGEAVVKAEVVARVKATYRWSFELEEVHDPGAWVPGTVELDGVSESLSVVPPLFSKVDVPTDYAFKLGGTTYVKEQAERFQMLYGRLSQITRVSFFSNVPVPKAKPFKNIDSETRACWDFMTKLFDDRPVWSIEMILHIVNGRWDRSVITAVLYGQTYKFRTGPWHNLFIRREFDPRKDADARRFQRINYELPTWTAVMTKRRLPKAMYNTTPSIDALNRFESLPGVVQAVLQVCDLEDPVIKAIIEDASQLPRYCSSKYGWFQEEQVTRIIKIVNERFGFLFDSQLEHTGDVAYPRLDKGNSILSPELMNKVLADMNADNEELDEEVMEQDEEDGLREGDMGHFLDFGSDPDA